MYAVFESVTLLALVVIFAGLLFSVCTMFLFVREGIGFVIRVCCKEPAQRQLVELNEGFDGSAGLVPASWVPEMRREP